MSDVREPAPSSCGSEAEAELLRLGYQPTLRRQLGFGALLVYGLLFFVPMAPVAVFGIVVNRSGGVPVLVYLVAAVMMGLSAISYREMALRFPVAGSVYGYVRLSTNRWLGFVAGWFMLLDYALMPALLTVLSAVALGHIFTAVPAVVFSVLFVGASLALNLQGVQITTRVGIVLLGIQVVVLAIFAWYVICALHAGTIQFTWLSLWREGVSWPAVLSAVTIAALSYLGFDAVATLNEEARGGGRAVAGATMVLLGLVTAVFIAQILLASIVTNASAFPQGAGTERAFYDAVDVVTPAWFTPVFTLTNAFVAIFACLLVAHSSSARLVFAMARDGLLPRGLAATNARGVPRAAVAVVAGVSLALAIGFAGHAELMTSLVTFGALSAYVVLHVAVLWRCGVRERSRRYLSHCIVPSLGITCLLVALWSASPIARNVGMGWLALGLATYAVLALRRPSRQTARSEEEQKES